MGQGRPTQLGPLERASDSLSYIYQTMDKVQNKPYSSVQHTPSSESFKVYKCMCVHGCRQEGVSVASVFLSTFEEVKIRKKERYTRNYYYFIIIMYFSAMNALGRQVQIGLNLSSVGLQANSLACISSRAKL
jgi:hypothetical protein